MLVLLRLLFCFFRDTLTQLQEKRFTFTQFFSRCGLFCLLWVVTNYALIHSLRILDTTDVLALYASNVSFVYLLSWVILHEQFVGIRVGNAQFKRSLITDMSVGALNAIASPILSIICSLEQTFYNCSCDSVVVGISQLRLLQQHLSHLFTLPRRCSRVLIFYCTDL